MQSGVRGALEQARALGGSRCELYVAAPEQPDAPPLIFDP